MSSPTVTRLWPPDPDTRIVTHLTMTGPNAGHVLCGVERNSLTMKFAHAGYCDENAPDVCEVCRFIHQNINVDLSIYEGENLLLLVLCEAHASMHKLAGRKLTLTSTEPVVSDYCPECFRAYRNAAIAARYQEQLPRELPYDPTRYYDPAERELLDALAEVGFPYHDVKQAMIGSPVLHFMAWTDDDGLLSVSYGPYRDDIVGRISWSNPNSAVNGTYDVNGWSWDGPVTRYPEPQAREESSEPDYKVAIYWTPEDVQSLFPGWSLDKCAERLSMVSERLEERSIEEGWDILKLLLSEQDTAQWKTMCPVCGAPLIVTSVTLIETSETVHPNTPLCSDGFEIPDAFDLSDTSTEDEQIECTGDSTHTFLLSDLSVD